MPQAVASYASGPAPGFVEAATQAAVNHLSARSPHLAAIIARVGLFKPQLTPNPFQALVGSIIHQQVSMAAARSMRRKLAAACPGGRITAAALLALSDAEFQAAGISRQKRGYLRDIATRSADGILRPARLRNLHDDEELIAALTEIKGVGRWTAEMLLIFSLQRWDVWPIGDLGLRRAIERVWVRRRPHDKKSLHAVGDPLRPYRSVATWYLWRSLESKFEPSLSE